VVLQQIGLRDLVREAGNIVNLLLAIPAAVSALSVW